MTNAAYYQSRYQADSRRPLIWREIVRYVHRWLPLNAHVLDLGAGYCDFINQVPAAKKYAVDLAEGVRTSAHSDVETHIGPVWDLDFIPSGSLDVVHASNLLEHLSDDELGRTIIAIRRVLKPGGTLILIQPNFALSVREYFDDYTHKKIFTHHSLVDFVSAHGFHIIHAESRFLPLSMRSRCLRLPFHPFLVRLYLSLPWRPWAGQMLVIAQT